MKESDHLLLQFLLAEHAGEEGAGEVAFGGAWQHDDYGLVLELLCRLDDSVSRDRVLAARGWYAPVLTIMVDRFRTVC